MSGRDRCRLAHSRLQGYMLRDARRLGEAGHLRQRRLLGVRRVASGANGSKLAEAPEPSTVARSRESGRPAPHRAPPGSVRYRRGVWVEPRRRYEVGVSCRPVWLQQVRSYPFVASAAAVRPNKETSTQVLWMQAIPLCTEWNVYKFQQDLVLERCICQCCGSSVRTASLWAIGTFGVFFQPSGHRFRQTWASVSITNGDKGQPCLVERVKLNVSEICPFVNILTKGFL
ncbi:uncharacterized protein [Narcine bancroftii]|uniref:uncharacterized protein n=1 Tax=Narcine bancroftii TaxID=1343680 RepID=UPI00383232F1